MSAKAQPSLDNAMEKRAREMHRVILLNDKTAWETFVRENYSQSLIDKPMRAQVSSSVNGATATSESKTATGIREKAMMFERLHDDFGDSQIRSLTPKGDTMEMVLQNTDGLTGTFSLKFQPASPYLIDGLGVNVKQ
jgi:hypothetical protein